MKKLERWIVIHFGEPCCRYIADTPEQALKRFAQVVGLRHRLTPEELKEHHLSVARCTVTIKTPSK